MAWQLAELMLIKAIDVRTAILPSSRRLTMQSATLRKWLEERGCEFRQHRKVRHKTSGFSSVTVRREGRTAELPLVGSRAEIPPEVVYAIVDQLGLDRNELPRIKGRA
jgi:hypothetical protein